MVIEWLTFEVTEADRAAWLDVEERVWSRFLEQQPGFVRKEMWTDRVDPDRVHAVVWWTDEPTWKRITPEQVAAVDAQMGEWFRDCSIQVFDVIREC